MSTPALLRLVFVLNLLLTTRFGVAQTPPRYQDPEPAAPRAALLVAPAAGLAARPAAQPAELVRYLTRTLALQPHQAQALRRALLAEPAVAATDADELHVSPLEEVRLLLSEPQLARLQLLQGAPVPAPELRWLTAVR